jgi:2-haloacid dehalogenase
MKNIIFDFGGVLLEWSADNFYLPYFNYDQNKMQRFYAETEIQTINKQIDKGLPFDIALKELASNFPEYAEPIFLWKNAWNKMIGQKIEGSIKILHQLHEQGYQLYGLTNWSAETFPFVYYTYPFFHLFKDIVVSGREKMIKPDAEIYQLCLERNALNAEESVFIDDNLENVIAFQQFGGKGIHFKNAEQLHSDLLKLGVTLTRKKELVA